ncbi:MAG: outer membrane beta-barrel protein [Paludibacteraceae bacterium]|nr:outer membrane beta-barrel protein [Paludibacteraceae bacterium]
MKRKSFLLIGLLLFVLQAKALDGYSYRVNLGAGFYNDTKNNISVTSGFVGLDFGWRMNKNLNLYVGLSYWDAEQSTKWYGDGNKYDWEGSMANLIITGSARFSTPELRLPHHEGLSLFIEPGINIEPMPVGIVNIDEYPKNSNYSSSYNGTKVSFFYPSWRLSAGVSYRFNNNLFIDLSYFISNMDLLKIYRKMTVDGQYLNYYIPRKENLNAIRFTLGLNL